MPFQALPALLTTLLAASAALAEAEPVPTYATEVAPIVAARCTACHRPGGIAPFSLESPDDLARRAKTVARAVREETMPPWFASAPAVPAHRFANDASLSDAEKATLLAWLDAAERPIGDLAKAPTPRGPAPEWRIGRPDAVFEIPHAVDIKAEGTMPYVNLRVDTNFTDEKWVRAWEVVPSAREVVHHVLVFAVEGGRARALDEARGFFAAYVPGGGMRIYTDGRAKRLPKGASLVFQLHYTPSGKPTTDRTKIGLVFADAPPAPEHQIRTAGIFDRNLDIPPNAANHREGTSFPLPADVRILSWMPHMHMRGKSFRMYAQSLDARTVLLDIPRYDFNWQLSYDYATPVELKRGTTLVLEATFDNSKDNPANPDPSQRVRWGQQTTDEMLIGYVEYELPKGGGELGGGGGARLGERLRERLRERGDAKKN